MKSVNNTYILKDIPHKLFEGDITKSGLKTPEELALFVEKYGRERIKQIKQEYQIK